MKIDVMVLLKPSEKDSERKLIFKHVTGYVFSEGNVVVYNGDQLVGHVPSGAFEGVWRIGDGLPPVGQNF